VRATESPRGQGSLQKNTTGGLNTARGRVVEGGCVALERIKNRWPYFLDPLYCQRAHRIGKVGTQTATFVAGIHGVSVAGGVGVVVSSSGQLGTVTSSARFKEAIKPMEKASEAILALQPVTFRYKHELDPDGIPRFGLVAERVERVNPDLVVRDEDGKVMTVATKRSTRCY